MPPLGSRFFTLRRGEPSVTGGKPPQLLHTQASSRFEAISSPPPDQKSISLPRRYAQMAQDLRPSLPFTCHWLDPNEVNLVDERPIAAGGFANVYEATHDGRKVILKSYRPYVLFDVAQVVARFRNEVSVCSLLRHGDVGVVSLVGVYSTEAHPFGLVYEYRDGLDLRQHLRNKPNAEGLKLLLEISRCLGRMHDLDVVHGNLRTANVLVDKDNIVRIAGLGSASILPHPMAITAESRTDTDRLSRDRAPELASPGMPPNPTEPMYPTKASDIYAFGVMAWEVLTGRPPFSEMTEVAATYSMLNGARPSRPHHRGISDQVWYIIERCWHSVPSERMSVEEVVSLLEAES